MERKNSDYTGGKTATDALANFKASAALGLHPVMGLLLRLQDKLMRIRSFVSDGELRVDGETVEDAFDDGINYLVLGKALLREQAGNKPMTIEEVISTPEWQAAAEQTKKEFGLDRVGNVNSFPTPKFGRDPSMGEPITEFKGFPEPEVVDPHAKLKAQYESDCETQVEPWRKWQYRSEKGGYWYNCINPPLWYANLEYRRI
jgi:hypothetical protein